MLCTTQFKLSRGAHAIDDPDKNTCLVEAAIIAAGFERHCVLSYRECPRCFSRVLVQYAIGINDAMPDELRNELLLPFVTRLAGTANRFIEVERARFIAFQAEKHFPKVPYIIYDRIPKIHNLLLHGYHEAVSVSIACLVFTAEFRHPQLDIWHAAAEILDGAIRIGKSKQAETMPVRIGPLVSAPIFPKPKRQLEFA